MQYVLFLCAIVNVLYNIMCLIQAGKTPLQVAEEMKRMEIVHLLKTGVPAGKGGREGEREREGGQT